MRQRATVEWLLHERSRVARSRFRTAPPVRRPACPGEASEAGGERGAPPCSASSAEACYVASWAREKRHRLSGLGDRGFIDDVRGAMGRRLGPTALKSVGLDESQYLAVLSQRACYHWAVDQGPNYFGYSTFSYPQALLTELQVTGGISALADAGGTA